MGMDGAGEETTMKPADSDRIAKRSELNGEDIVSNFDVTRTA